MTNEQFDTLVAVQFDRCAAILQNKSAEYASDADRLHNFNAGAALTGQTPRQVLFGFMLKHIISVADMAVSNAAYTAPMWDEKLTDLINYCVLLRAVVAEESAYDNTTA